jgi:hypothetical protein
MDSSLESTQRSTISDQEHDSKRGMKARAAAGVEATLLSKTAVVGTVAGTMVVGRMGEEVTATAGDLCVCLQFLSI